MLERNCPFLDDRQKIKVKHQRKSSGVDKYAIKTKKRKQKDAEPEEDKPKGILQVGSFSFEECPVAYTKSERWLISIISLINWSEDMHTPLLDGGLLNYNNWFYEARNIVVGEQRMIENEETKRRQKAAERKGKIRGGKGSPRSALGRRRK